MFSSRSFIVWGFLSRFLIPLKLILCWATDMGLVSFFYMLTLSFPSTICEISVTHTHVCVFYFVLFTFMSLSVPMEYWLHYHSSVTHLEIRNGHPSSIVLFLQGCFGVLLVTWELEDGFAFL